MTVQRGLWLAKRLSLNLNVSFLHRISLLLMSSSYSIVLTRLGGPRPDPILLGKNLGNSRESNPGPLWWQSDVLTTVQNRRSTKNIREESKRRISMGNACYYSLEGILLSRLLPKNLKINTAHIKPQYYRSYCIVMKFSLSPWEGSTGKGCSRIKYLGRYLGLREVKLQENGESYIMLSYITLYSLPNTIRKLKTRRLRWAGHVARMGQSRNVYRVLVGKPEGKRSLGRPRRRWEDNIKMDFTEVGCDPGN